MGDVTLPAPVGVAVGGLCILAGYLLGVVTGPDTPTLTKAVVRSYDPASGRLCLTGDNVSGQAGAQGTLLCGTWRRTEGSTAIPTAGDSFRFVSTVEDAQQSSAASQDRKTTVVYGDVVP